VKSTRSYAFDVGETELLVVELGWMGGIRILLLGKIRSHLVGLQISLSFPAELQVTSFLAYPFS
jgi:hypothetical protein